jgi:hypothetical protein
MWLDRRWVWREENVAGRRSEQQSAVVHSSRQNDASVLPRVPARNAVKLVLARNAAKPALARNGERQRRRLVVVQSELRAERKVAHIKRHKVPIGVQQYLEAEAVVAERKPRNLVRSRSTISKQSQAWHKSSSMQGS